MLGETFTGGTAQMLSSLGPLMLRRRTSTKNGSFTPLAAFISNVVLIAIVVSTLSFVVGTVPYMQTHEYSEEILEIIEIVVVSIFTVEYVLRFLVCPTGRCAFVLSPLNMVDLLAILPFYLEQFGSAIGESAETSDWQGCAGGRREL